MDALYLETFKVRLDRGLSSLFSLKMSLLIVVGLKQMAFKRSLPAQTILGFSDSILNIETWLQDI